MSTSYGVARPPYTIRSATRRAMRIAGHTATPIAAAAITAARWLRPKIPPTTTAATANATSSNPATVAYSTVFLTTTSRS